MNTIIKYALLIVFLLFSTLVNGQGDYKELWTINEKIRSGATLLRIVPQHDGTYIAVGRAPAQDGTDKYTGYFVHFNEFGEIIRDALLAPPNTNGVWTATAANPNPETNAQTPVLFAMGSINTAYLTSDSKEILLFGTVVNRAVAENLKGMHLGTHPNNKNNPYLINGTWVMKYNIAQQKLVANQLERGEFVSGGVRLENDVAGGEDIFIITGADSGYRDPVTGKFPGSYLLRAYNKNLTWVFDQRRDLNQNPGQAYYMLETPLLSQRQAGATKGEFSLVNPAGLADYQYKVNTGGTSVAITNVGATPGLYFSYSIYNGTWFPATNSCVQYPVAQGIQPYVDGFTFDGWAGPSGVFSKLDTSHAWVVGRNFAAWYKNNATGIRHPSASGNGAYILLMDRNNPSKYSFCHQVGAVTAPYANFTLPYTLRGGVLLGVFASYKNDHPFQGAVESRFYELEETGTYKYNFVLKSPTPNNGSISAVSLSDGFFMIGSGTGRSSITKMSTCGSFKISDEKSTVLLDDIYIPTTMDNFTMAVNKTLPIEGALNGTVKYTVEAYLEEGSVDGNTTPRLLYKDQDLNAISNSSLGTINKTFNANKPSSIKYIVSMTNTYLAGIKTESCIRTYQFYVKSLPQTNIVALPSLDTEKKNIHTSVKNIGIAPFFNKYSIDIYKNGEAIPSQTFVHNSTIHVGDMIDFVIPLNSSMIGASSISLRYNASGGSKESSEMNNTIVDTDIVVTGI